MAFPCLTGLPVSLKGHQLQLISLTTMGTDNIKPRWLRALPRRCGRTLRGRRVPVPVCGSDPDETRQYADGGLSCRDDFPRTLLIIPDGELALKAL